MTQIKEKLLSWLSRFIHNPTVWFVGIGAGILVVAVACFAGLPSSPFRDSFLGNFLATLAGVAIGVPVALWLNREQTNEREEKRAEDARIRKRDCLKLIKSELDYNLRGLRNAVSELDGCPKRVVYLDSLKNETWNGISDSGELRWIRDLALTDSISFAYYLIRCIIFLEGLYLEDKYRKNTCGEEIMGSLRLLDPKAIKAIEKALEAIDKDLGSTCAQKQYS